MFKFEENLQQIKASPFSISKKKMRIGTPKINGTVCIYSVVVGPKASSVGPDQTLRSSLIWVLTV